MTPSCDLVIGGTRGLGREIAIRWAEAGATVHTVGRRPPEGAPLARPQFWPVDLAQKAAVADFCTRFMADHPKIGRVVFAQRCARAESPEQEMQVAVFATIQIIEALAPAFTRDTGTSIVLIGSLASHHISLRQGIGYHLAKATLPQVARYYAWRLGPAKVRINVLSPCYFLKAQQEQPPAALAPLQQLGPARGSLRSAEILPWIDFLTSPASGAVTGREIEVDHGAGLLDPESRLLAAPTSTTP